MPSLMHFLESIFRRWKLQVDIRLVEREDHAADRLVQQRPLALQWKSGPEDSWVNGTTDLAEIEAMIDAEARR
ncbi:hypothetical protein ACWTU6_27450 [Mesorhizobium sp. BHbsci]